MTIPFVDEETQSFDSIRFVFKINSEVSDNSLKYSTEVIDDNDRTADLDSYEYQSKPDEYPINLENYYVKTVQTSSAIRLIGDAINQNFFQKDTNLNTNQNISKNNFTEKILFSLNSLAKFVNCIKNCF